MKIVKTFFVALLVLGVTAVQAQKIKLKEGDFTALKGQSQVLLEYDYSEMGVGKFDKEEDYVSKKVAEMNEKKDGSGDEWAEKWVADREAKFQPKFEELLNKYTVDKANCEFSPMNINATYTLILKTTFTEPGFNVGVVRKDAMINVEVKLVETANPDNVLAVLTMDNVPGRDVGGYDFDTGYRLSEAYAKCGKSLATFLLKKGFK